MNNRIRELRLEKRITQLQLSIALNVTQETISAYEHNRHMPSLAALIKMSEIFNASMDYIMGLSNVRHILNEPTDKANEAEQKTKLLDCYNKLGTKNKARLIAYAEGLLDSAND
ncbi:MAG: helix-turn-helix transcriptional regulator [Lachnospiraceae bacterium]|nr:helix-turn-helix transcriptional regulator [Lachnospiraceae bacterium]